MNASELSTDGFFRTWNTPWKLVGLCEMSDEEDLIEAHRLTPAEARLLAEQIDSGQSPLPPDEARTLATALYESAGTVEAGPIPCEAALAVYRHLKFSRLDSWSWHLRSQPGTYSLGLIAMHDLMTNLGLDRQAVLAALEVLREHDHIHDIQTEPGMAPRIKLGRAPWRGNRDL